MNMSFKDKLIELLKDQAENHADEYVNPHLLSEMLSAMYTVGYMDHIPDKEQVILDKYVSDMWGY